jgi:hypothetical protein
MPQDAINTGQCACGAVRFRTQGPLRPIIYCHCSQCRRQTGHYLAATACPDAALTVTAGAAQIRWFASSPDAQRAFCATCGSGLFWKNRTRTETSIMAGLFDEPNDLTPGRHIFVADKGCYYTISDGLPQDAPKQPVTPPSAAPRASASPSKA